ncbi:MAG: hypothetical protein AAB400_03720 [Patescibacteria group bacterium]
MFDRITHPEKFIDAEHAGKNWIAQEKKNYTGFSEVLKSFLSLKNTEFNPMYSIVFKYGGTAVAGMSAYGTKFLERTEDPLLVGGVLLASGVLGLSTIVMGTVDSMKRRKILQERKLARKTS